VALFARNSTSRASPPARPSRDGFRRLVDGSVVIWDRTCRRKNATTSPAVDNPPMRKADGRGRRVAVVTGATGAQGARSV
jgi:hypothetical protein